jgi:hypothetical protein
LKQRKQENRYQDKLHNNQRSTLASLGKGLAELSTDGQFLQLRTKQVVFFFFFSSKPTSGNVNQKTDFDMRSGYIKENHRGG